MRRMATPEPVKFPDSSGFLLDQTITKVKKHEADGYSGTCKFPDPSGFPLDQTISKVQNPRSVSGL